MLQVSLHWWRVRPNGRFGVRGLGPEDKESEVSKLFEMLDSAAKGTLKDKTGKAVKVVLPKVDDSAPPVQARACTTSS